MIENEKNSNNEINEQNQNNIINTNAQLKSENVIFYQSKNINKFY